MAKNNMNFKVNVDFVAKTNKDLGAYIDAIKQAKETLGQRLGSSFLDDTVTEVKRVQKELISMDKIASNSKLTKKEKVSALTGIIQDAQKLAPMLKNLNKTWLNDALKNNDEILQQLDDMYAKQKKLSTLKGKKTRATNEQNEAEATLDSLGVNEKTKKNLTSIQKNLNNKKLQLDANKEKGIFDNEDLETEISLLEKESKALTDFLNAGKKITNVNKELSELSAIDGKGGLTDVDKISSRFDKAIANLTSVSESAEGIKQVSTAIGDTSSQVEIVSNDLEGLDSGLERTIQLGEQGEEVAKTLKQVLSEFGIVGVSAVQVVRVFKELISTALEFYTSLDNALNQIYVVSNLSISSVNSLKSNFINMAKETGMAIDDVTEAAVLFYQQGLNTDEVLTMTEVTSEFAKVAGIDATDAADKLTAAVNGYCLAAEDASTVADKFNQVAAASAADINELSTAFSKAAAQANQAGVSMDNYLAYIATMEEATREAPENIGTSLKTIFSRMQQIKTGENTEDDTDVNNVETALKSVGVQLRDTTGQLRDLEEIFDELGPKWNTLDRNTQAYLGTIIAGTRQQSRFITLMQNWDRVLELSEESANSAGMQSLMHAKAMDSITSKVQQFQVAWQEFVSNLTSSDFIKGIVSWATKLLKMLNNGVKPITLIATAVGLLSTKLKSLQEPLKNGAQGLVKGFKALTGAAKGSFYSDKKGNNGQIISGEDQKKADLAVAMEAEYKAQEQVNKLLSDRTKIQEKIADYNVKETENGKLSQKDQEKLNNLKTKEEELNSELSKGEEDLKNKAKERQGIEEKEVMTKGEAISKVGTAIGTALNTIGIAIGQTDEMAGGLVSSLGSLTTGISQIVSQNYIGGITTLLMTAYQLGTTLANKEEYMAAKITNAVDEVKSALTEVSNYNTGIKSTENLLDKYEELDKKIYRTETEQEDLNNIVQELSDTYDIDTVTDAYGNLSINLKEVNKALEEQKALRDQAAKELDKAEVEGALSATSGLFNNNTLEDYYQQLFSTTRSSYKTLLTGVEDDLTDESRNISSNLADTFSNNLESAIMDQVESNKFEYIGEGIAQGLIGIQDELNDTLSSGDWNELYEELDFLEKNVDDMSYDQVQESLSSFYETWGAANDLTQEQWDLLVDSINNTVFENSSLLEFYDQVNSMGEKMSGKYYDNQISKIEEQKKALEEETTIFEEHMAATSTIAGIGAGAAGVGGSLLAAGAIDSWNPSGWVIAGIGALTAAVGGIATYAASNTEEGKKLKEMKKAIDELEEQKEEYMKELVEEHTFLFDEADAEKWYNSQVAVMDVMQSLDTTTQNYLSNIESLYDMDNMTAEGAEEYANTLKNSLTGLQGLDTEGEQYNYLANYYKEHSSEMSEEIKAQWEIILNEAFDNLSITSTQTLTQISTNLQSISSDLIKMNGIIEEFNDAGSISLDTFMDLADIIDGLGSNISDLGALDPQAVYDYIDAIDDLDLAYDENTGQITMNADSIATLQDIQQAQVKAKLAGMIADLKASKATTETEIAYIDAQIAGTDAAIAAVEADTEASLTSDQIKAKADASFADTFDKSMGDISSDYENDVTNNGEWATTILNNISKVSEAWNKYFTAVRNGGEADLESIKSAASDIMKNADIKWEGGSSYSGIDWASYDAGNMTQKELVNKLQTYRKELENTKNSYQATLTVTNQSISALEDMMGKDLSALGTSTNETSKDIEKYIGKLKELYNVLNQIETIENRLDTLETFEQVAVGKDKAAYIQEEIDLYGKQMDKYKTLIGMQQDLVASEQAAIKNSVVGDVFSFDEFGSIIIDYDKYLALQDEAIDGEQTLKELADNLYDEYESYYDELKDDFLEYIDYLEKVIDLQQEQVDAYVDLETELGETVKQIYQDMLDSKLDAIDAEIDALDELKEAYDDANQAKEDSEEISKLQTSLKRASMDTSGASNTKVLSYQDQLQSKLEEMGEDQYTKRLDDIKTALEDEKQTLQDNFDKYFEDYSAFYDMIEKRIMTKEETTQSVLTLSNNYKQATAAERQQMMQDWDTTYHTAMDNLGKGSILDVVSSIYDLKARVGELDDILMTPGDADRVGKEVSDAIREYYDSFDNGDSNSETVNTGSGGSSYGGSGSGISSVDDTTSYTTTAGDQTHSSVIDDTQEVISNWWTNFKQSVSDFFTQTIPHFFTETIPEWFGQLKDTLKQWWDENIAPKLSLKYWVDKGASLLGTIDGTLLAIKDKFVNWWNENMAQYFTLEFWKEKISSIGQSIEDFITVTIPEKWGEITEWWDTNISPIFTKEYWVDKWNSVTQSISDWWTSVKEWWNTKVVTWWDNNVKVLFTKEYWVNKWNTIKEGFVEGVKNALNGVIDKFNAFGKKLGGWVHSITDWVGDKFNAISNWWSSLTGSAKESYNKSKQASYDEVMEGFKTGGIADFTGPAWLDGTKSAPEAVLNAAQTKSFMKLADNLEKLDTNGVNQATNVSIGNIEFKVESMSSVEDGEIAFDAFVQKFKEIGTRTGLTINS